MPFANGVERPGTNLNKARLRLEWWRNQGAQAEGGSKHNFD